MQKDRKMVQTTVRLDQELLRELQYYLSLERQSLSEFVRNHAQEYLRDYRLKHPDRVPGGAHNSD